MIEELESFLALPGVGGLCFHRGTDVLQHQFPAPYGSAGAGELARALTASFSAYWRAGRPLTQVFFQYPEALIWSMTVLPQRDPATTASEAPLLTEPFLTFLLRDRTPLPRLPAPVRAFLLRQARIEVAVWEEFRAGLIHLIGKVLNRAQCEKMVLRVMTSLGHTPELGIPRDQFRAVGEAVIREIPSRARQAPLLEELHSLIAGLRPH